MTMTEVATACTALVADGKYLTAMGNAGFNTLIAVAMFDEQKLVKDALPDLSSIKKLCVILLIMRREMIFLNIVWPWI